MAQMAPDLEVIEHASLNPRHMTLFHMAPHGTTWRSRAKCGSITRIPDFHMAQVKSFTFNNGAMCAICAI